jgi:predicted ATPase
MKSMKIVVKNYRCFSDDVPCSIDFCSGFISLVGPNNSGKSTLLRMFYELRSLFENLRNLNVLMELFRESQQNFSAVGVEDQNEIFTNRNNRNIIIELEINEAALNEINKVVVEINRNQPNSYKAFFYYEDPAIRVGRYQTTINDVQRIYAFTIDGITTHLSMDGYFKFLDVITNSLYIGAFRNAINEGSGSYYDIPVGTAFISQWNNWKTGGTRRQNEVAQKISDTLAHIFGYSRLEINSTPDQKALQIIVDGKPYRLRELGSGLAQFIIVLGHVAMRKPMYLFVDEPELNLHPSLQLDFITSLAEYSEYGIMFASHSIGLARSSSERIYSFQKKDEKYTVRQFDQTTNLTEFLGEMSYSAFKELGFETVLLVEGITDVKTIQQFLRKFNKDHSIVVLPLGGAQFINSNVESEMTELKRISNKIAVIIDSEKGSEDEPIDVERMRFAKICRSLGFNIHITEKRATENYLSERAIKEIKGDSYRGLAPYELLRDTELGWAKSDNWRIARVMTKEELLDNDLGVFLSSL